MSDFSRHALAICCARDSRLDTCLPDAEHHDLPDESFDMVIVQMMVAGVVKPDHTNTVPDGR